MLLVGDASASILHGMNARTQPTPTGRFFLADVRNSSEVRRGEMMGCALIESSDSICIFCFRCHNLTISNSCYVQVAKSAATRAVSSAGDPVPIKSVHLSRRSKFTGVDYHRWSEAIRDRGTYQAQKARVEEFVNGIFIFIFIYNILPSLAPRHDYRYSSL